MNKCIASAPGKLMLLGDHAVVYDHPCIVTAVNQRLYVETEKQEPALLTLKAPDLGLQKYEKALSQLGTGPLPKPVQFIENVYKRFLEKYPQTSGVTVQTRSDFSSTFGFGSSSAVSTAFAFSLFKLYEIPFTNQELFDLCYRAVLDVQGVGSGFDIASAIWGGTLLYKRGASVLEKVSVKQLPIIVVYTGIKADTPTIVRQVGEQYKQDPQGVEALFSLSEEDVFAGKSALEKGDWKALGQIFSHSQELLEKLHVSSESIQQSCSALVESGCFGAKLSGAGIGDCVLGVSSPEQLEELKKNFKPFQVMNVELQAEGVREEPSV